MRRVALFRAVNVGGTGKVAMADLRAAFVKAGFSDARTVMQTGIVLFGSEAAPVDLEPRIQEFCEAEVGLKSEVHVRTAEEWKGVVLANPFPPDAEADPSHLLVTFYRMPLDEGEVNEVASRIAGPERIQAVGRELYAVYPEGIGTSTISKTPGWRRLCSTGTARNWNTVLKIAQLLAVS